MGGEAVCAKALGSQDLKEVMGGEAVCAKHHLNKGGK
jgi:hypothetical protein